MVRVISAYVGAMSGSSGTMIRLMSFDARLKYPTAAVESSAAI